MSEKIITADFSNGEESLKIKGLWQHDYGSKLKVLGIPYSDVIQVDFANINSSKATPVVTEPKEDGSFVADIPNSLLEQPINIMAYIYLATSDYGHTIKNILLPIIQRPKRNTDPGEDINPGDNPFQNALKQIKQNTEDIEKLNDEMEEMKENGTGGGITTESDPTVPAWAKSENKPSYTPEEVGADPTGTAENKVSAHNTSEESHNDIRLLIKGLATRLNTLANSDDTTLDQMAEVVTYIKSNKSLIDTITTSKVSVTDIIDNLTTSVSDKPLSAKQGAALKLLIDTVSNEIGNKQPKGDYALKSELEAETTAREQAVASLNARLGQQTVFVAEGETQEEAEAWLEENGDTTKLYLMPDETFWQYKKATELVEGGATYTNILPLAKDTDRTTIYNRKGYKENTKLSGSGGGASTAGTGKEAMCSSGFIFPVVAGDKLYMKGIFPVTGSNHYVVGYDSANARTGNDTLVFTTSDNGLIWTTGTSSGKYTIEEDGTIVYTINTAKLGENVNAVRICAGMDENTIITINEEIKEGGGTTTVIVEKWVSTGHGLLATNYDAVIASLNSIVNAHTEEINELKKGVATTLTDTEKLELIKKWDVPIYDAHIPVFELSAEKSAITEAEKTVDAVYAKYDALMAKYPNYITKTDLGLCSDGVTHVYRYDFRESEPHRGITGAKEWSETKTRAIIVSGIHWEWGGIFALYNALEEIAENPNLFDLRRNTHLIVLPVCNPYAVANMSVRNANQVEIHRNFEVDFIYPGESGYIEIGERSHGGTEPLSEVETQYIDNIFKENTDAALFLTCHSYQSDSVWGTGFTWASPATYYMCNLHYRVVDKLSKSWMDRFGETLAQGIEDYKTENLADGDTRLGSAYLSTTNGTETKQATKYGIQATNVEVCDTFWVHGTTENPEPTLSSFTMSRGAEVYVNFLLTALGVYDYKDKEQYYK